MGVNKISRKRNQKGLIFDLQRYSIHDGPGIRTLIFFKGCRLRCQWCSNPESWHTYPQMLYDESACVQWWTGVAQGLGIEVYWPGDPALSRYRYGYDYEREKQDIESKVYEITMVTLQGLIIADVGTGKENE